MASEIQDDVERKHFAQAKKKGFHVGVEEQATKVHLHHCSSNYQGDLGRLERGSSSRVCPLREEGWNSGTKYWRSLLLLSYFGS